MKALVVGSGSWGTAFARLLADRGHAVTLATHRAEDARAIAETGRNPRYLTQVALDDVAAVPFALVMVGIAWALVKDLRNDPMMVRRRYAAQADAWELAA